MSYLIQFSPSTGYWLVVEAGTLRDIGSTDDPNVARLVAAVLTDPTVGKASKTGWLRNVTEYGLFRLREGFEVTE